MREELKIVKLQSTDFIKISVMPNGAKIRSMIDKNDLRRVKHDCCLQSWKAIREFDYRISKPTSTSCRLNLCSRLTIRAKSRWPKKIKRSIANIVRANNNYDPWSSIIFVPSLRKPALKAPLVHSPVPSFFSWKIPVDSIVMVTTAYKTRPGENLTAIHLVYAQPVSHVLLYSTTT